MSMNQTVQSQCFLFLCTHQDDTHNSGHTDCMKHVNKELLKKHVTGKCIAKNTNTTTSKNMTHMIEKVIKCLKLIKDCMT